MRLLVLFAAAAAAAGAAALQVEVPATPGAGGGTGAGSQGAVSAILPVVRSDAARAEILLDSLARFAAPGTFRRVYVVVPPRDYAYFRDSTRVAGFPFVALLNETAVADELRASVNAPGLDPSLLGWFKQQLLKLAIATTHIDTDFYFCFDADNVLVKPLAAGDLVAPDGRGIMTLAHRTPKTTHYLPVTEALLGMNVSETAFPHIMGVTPALLSTHVVRRLAQHIEAAHRADADYPGNWRRYLLTRLFRWTEYHLYFVFAASVDDLWHRYHVDHGPAQLRRQEDPALMTDATAWQRPVYGLGSVWKDDDFSLWDPAAYFCNTGILGHYFVVLQSRNPACEPARIRAMVAPYLERGCGASPPPAPAVQRRAAYATVVSSTSYVLGATVTLHSLARTRPTLPVVCLVTASVDAGAARVLASAGCEVRTISDIANPAGDLRSAFNQTYSKLHVWTLDQAGLDVVIYIDADTVVRRNMDHLAADYDPRRGIVWAAQDSAPLCECVQKERVGAPLIELNTGVMVLQPDSAVFSDMLSKIDDPQFRSYDRSDQGFLNNYLVGRWHQIPTSYNLLALGTHRCNSTQFDAMAARNMADVYLVHFTGRKPWFPEVIQSWLLEEPLDAFTALWWREYAEVAERFPILGQNIRQYAARLLPFGRWEKTPRNSVSQTPTCSGSVADGVCCSRDGQQTCYGVSAMPFLFREIRPFRPGPFREQRLECPANLNTTQIGEDLAPWGGGALKAGTLEDAFLRVVSDPEHTMRAAFVQIIDNRLYVECPAAVEEMEESNSRVSLRTFVAMLLYILQSRKVPDVEFVLSFHDSASEYPEPIASEMPLFSCCKPRGSRHILIPRPYFNNGHMWEPEHSHRLENYHDFPWAVKEERAVFRGAISSFDRVRLYTIGRQHPDTLDIALTKVPAFAEKWIPEYGIEVSEPLSMRAQQRFKYVLNVDGVASADRLRYLLGGDATVIKQDSDEIEWWYPQLVPGEHYVPTSAQFDDLVGRVQWLRDNDAAAQRIAQTATAWVRDHLSVEHDVCYFAALLDRFAAIQQYPIVRRPGAVAVVPDGVQSGH